jgi:biopolymer transport protein ExbB/TolQ
MNSLYLSGIVLALLIAMLFALVSSARAAGRSQQESKTSTRELNSLKRFHNEMRKPLSKGSDLVRRLRDRARRVQDE